MNIVLDVPKFMPAEQSTLVMFSGFLDFWIKKIKVANEHVKGLQQEAMNSPQAIEPEDELVERLQKIKKEIFIIQQDIGKVNWIFRVIFFYKIKVLIGFLEIGISEINTLITFIKERNADFSPISGKGPFYDFESLWKALNSEDDQ